MAPRKPPIEKDPLLELDQADQEELDVYEFIENIGPNIATVDVFRMNRDGTRPQVERVTIDVIREDVYSYLRTLGAGKYLLQFKSADRSIRKAKVVEVADKLGAGPAPAAPSTTGSDALTFLREQLAQQQTLLLALIANMGQNKGPDLSFLAGVLKPPDMSPVVTLMSAMIARKPEGGLDGVQLAKTIVDISRDIGGGGSEPENFWSVAKDVGKGLFGNMTAGGPPVQIGPAPVHVVYPDPPQIPPRPILPPAAMPQGPGGPVHNPNPTTEDETMQVTRANFTHWLRAGLAQLKPKAALGKDIDQCVDWVLDNPEEPQWAAIAGAVEQGATFDNLLQFDPEIAQNPQLKVWFGNFYNALHAEIHTPVDSAGAGRDRPDAEHNGPAGTAGPISTGSAAVSGPTE